MSVLVRRFDIGMEPLTLTCMHSPSQVEMAEALGVGQSLVSKVERGESYVDFFLFLQWCKACGVNPLRPLKKLLADMS